jgi:polysaccharide chain length determinant protein (PEP-CTERM system associated)
VTGLVVVVSLVLPRYYRSETTILVEEKRVQNPLMQDVAVLTSVKDRLRTLKAKILSHDRLSRVVRELGLDDEIETPAEFEDLIEEMGNRIRLTMRGFDVIELSYEDRDPHTARDVVDKMTALLIEENLELMEREIREAVAFFRQELDGYRAELEQAEARVRTFREEHLMDLMESGEIDEESGAVVSAEPVDLRALAGFQRELVDRKIEEKELRGRFAALEKRRAREEELVLTGRERSGNPAVAVLQQKLWDMKMELQNMLVDSTERHPDVVRLREDIRRYEDLLAEERQRMVDEQEYVMNPRLEEIQQRILDVELALGANIDRQAELVRLIDEYGDRIRRIPALESERAKLTRDYETKQKFFQMFLEHLETANISERLELRQQGTRFEILDPPRLPLRPSRPQRRLLAVLGLFLGILIGGAVAYAREAVDDSFRDPMSAGAVLGVPVLGTIPSIAGEAEERRRRRSRTAGYVGAAVLLLLLLAAALAGG